jgi:hypothetical protein
MRSALAAVLMCCAVAGAQPSGPDARLIADLTTLERSASNRALSLREREAAADQAIDLRRRLIAAAPDTEPRLIAWLIDQSAALLARLGRDGSDSAALFGLPGPAQREAVHSSAIECVRHLERAARIIGPPPEGGETEERSVRVAFFRARAEILLGALEQGPRRPAHAQTALSLIGKVGFATPGPEAIRRVGVGAALLMKSSPPAPQDAQLAVEEFAWAALGGDNPDEPAPSISSATRVEGWLGLVHAAGALGNVRSAAARLRQAMAREPFVADRRPDPLAAALAADTLTRIYFEQGLASADRGLLDAAIAEQMELIARTDLGFRAEALRPSAFDKLAALADRAPADAELPAGFDLAAAIRAARDARQREAAIAEFERIAARPDAGSFAGDALWEAAVLLLQGTASAEPLRGIAHLTTIASAMPDHARAAEAIAAALPHAKHYAQGEPSDARAAAAYRQALILATDRHQTLQEIDLWRYERGRLALTEPTPEPEMRSALLALRQIAAPRGDAVRLTERLQAALMERIRARHSAARAADPVPIPAAARSLAAEELEPEARAAHA